MSSTPYRVLTAVLVMMLGVPAQLWAGDDREIATVLLPLEPLGVDAEPVARLEALLRAELGRLHFTAPLSPSEVEQVIAKNSALRRCGGDNSCLGAIGAATGAERVIAGQVGGLGGSYVIQLKMVAAPDGALLSRVELPIQGDPSAIPHEAIESIRLGAYQLAAPEKVTGEVAVLANRDGAEVALDGRTVGKTPLDAPVRAATGSHQLALRLDGYRPYSQSIEVAFQKLTVVSVELSAPKRSRAAAPVKKVTRWHQRPWVWIAAGAVVAGASVYWGYHTGGDAILHCEPATPACTP